MFGGVTGTTSRTRSAPRFAAYLRISRDPLGTQTATSRQLREIRAFARAKNWNIVQVYEDVDVSAFDRKVERPQYEAMLVALKDGELDGVVCWKLDRLARRVAEFGRFWEVAEVAGATLASVTESLDTSSPVGMLVIHVLTAFAEMESQNTSLRLRAQERQKLAAGRPKIAGRRPYGLTADWGELVPEEAEVIRQAAKRLLSGDSLRSIALDLNERGVPTATGGGPWRAQTLRILLRQPRLWGERSYEGTTVALQGVPRVLSPAVGRRVAALLDQRGGVPNRPRKFLLSGLLRCWRCGAGLRGGQTSPSASGPKARYACPARPDGCGGTAVLVDNADTAIIDMVLYRLDSPELRQLRQRNTTTKKGEGDARVLAELAAAEQRGRELARLWARGELSTAEHRSMARELEQHAGELRAKLAEARAVDRPAA